MDILLGLIGAYKEAVRLDLQGNPAGSLKALLRGFEILVRHACFKHLPSSVREALCHCHLNVYEDLADQTASGASSGSGSADSSADSGESGGGTQDTSSIGPGGRQAQLEYFMDPAVFRALFLPEGVQGVAWQTNLGSTYQDAYAAARFAAAVTSVVFPCGVGAVSAVDARGGLFARLPAAKNRSMAALGFWDAGESLFKFCCGRAGVERAPALIDLFDKELYHCAGAGHWGDSVGAVDALRAVLRCAGLEAREFELACFLAATRWAPHWDDPVGVHRAINECSKLAIVSIIGSEVFKALEHQIASQLPPVERRGTSVGSARLPDDDPQLLRLAALLASLRAGSTLWLDASREGLCRLAELYGIECINGDAVLAAILEAKRGAQVAAETTAMDAVDEAYVYFGLEASLLLDTPVEGAPEQRPLSLYGFAVEVIQGVAHRLCSPINGYEALLNRKLATGPERSVSLMARDWTDREICEAWLGVPAEAVAGGGGALAPAAANSAVGSAPGAQLGLAGQGAGGDGDDSAENVGESLPPAEGSVVRQTVLQPAVAPVAPEVLRAAARVIAAAPAALPAAAHEAVLVGQGGAPAARAARVSAAGSTAMRDLRAVAAVAAAEEDGVAPEDKASGSKPGAVEAGAEKVGTNGPAVMQEKEQPELLQGAHDDVAIAGKKAAERALGPAARPCGKGSAVWRGQQQPGADNENAGPSKAAGAKERGGAANARPKARSPAKTADRPAPRAPAPIVAPQPAPAPLPDLALAPPPPPLPAPALPLALPAPPAAQPDGGTAGELSSDSSSGGADGIEDSGGHSHDDRSVSAGPSWEPLVLAHAITIDLVVNAPLKNDGVSTRGRAPTSEVGLRALTLEVMKIALAGLDKLDGVDVVESETLKRHCGRVMVLFASKQGNIISGMPAAQRG